MNELESRVVTQERCQRRIGMTNHDAGAGKFGVAGPVWSARPSGQVTGEFLIAVDVRSTIHGDR